MTTKLKLWISPGACSLLTHIILREANIDFDLVTIDVTKGAFSEEAKKINPKQRIPILEFGDGTVLTETVAIVTYAAQLSPGKNLLGKTMLEVARSYEWLNWLSGTVHERGLGATFRPQSYTDDPAALESVQKKCMQFLRDCFGLIEGRIVGLHAVGDGFTATDVFLYVIYRWGYLIGWDMPGLYPKWTKLVDGVIERDCVKAAVEREGIPIIQDNRAPPPHVQAVKDGN